MSQYNTPPTGDFGLPHAGMNPYGPEPGNSLPWCRSAGVMQIVLGSLTALMSFCMGIMSTQAKNGKLPPESLEQLNRLASSSGLSVQTLLLAASVAMFVPAVLLIALGIFVWRGSRVGIILSLILAALGAAYVLLNTVVAAAEGAAGGAGVCIMAVPLGLSVTLFVLLIRAWLEARKAKQPNAAYMAQVQQYYQQYYQRQQQQYQAGSQPPQGPVASPPPPPPGGPSNPPPPPFQ